MNKIRPLAICLFRHNNCILVAEGYDPAKKEHFYRPLGGGIEFGEYSEQTIHRELKEEIGAEVCELKYLGTVENVYVFNGTPGHEIIQIYDGVLEDAELYELPEIIGREMDIDTTFRAVWKPVDEFGAGNSILYPTGLLELLK
jgi:8-oxo-dGTP pyrophosphatase MutT (NUDIX family)